MKIVFFTENHYAGGMDSFIITLINNWPGLFDELIVMGNQSHPGLDVIEKRITRSCKIIRHKLPVYYDILQIIKKNPHLHLLQKLILPLQYVLFIYYIFALRKLLLKELPNRLMVVAGSYPGGDTCRAAVISWGLFSKRPDAIYNFHNVAITPHWAKIWIENLIDRMVSFFSRHFITVSAAAAQSIEKRPAIANKKKTFFIYNGIDPPHDYPLTIGLSLKKELGLSPHNNICLMLGTYEVRKGHQFLLQSFQRVVRKMPSAHLVICGYGLPEEIKRVRMLIDHFSMTEHVHVFNFRNDVAYLLKNSDVLLVASQYYESFGLTCVEAMAHHVPVVATQVGGLPEVVCEGEGGYCLPPDDAEGYASRILSLLEDEGLRKEQGEKGYQRYLRMFTGERMAMEYAQIICN